MNTENLISYSRSRFDHAVANTVLREKYQGRMIFAYQEGLFRAGPELLTLLQAIPVEDDVVILDLYQNPVKITPGELQRLAFDRWQEQMTAWLLEFEASTQKR